MINQKATSLKVKGIVADQFGLNHDEITDETSLESVGADSLDRVEICMALEEEFGIDISDEDAELVLSTTSTIGQIEEYVIRQLD